MQSCVLAKHSLPPAWYLEAVAQAGVSRIVRVDGVDLHCLTWNLDDEIKPVLLLQHGYWAHAHWWDFIAPFFLDRYRVVAPDFAGMGDSAHRPSYDVPSYVRDLAGLIQALALPPVSAVAHSFGGSLLMHVCAAHPGLFRHAVVIDSYFDFPDVTSSVPPRKEVAGGRIYADLAAALARFRLMPPQRHALPYLVDHIARHSLRETDGGWRWKFDAALPVDVGAENFGPDLLVRVQMPVDIVYGGKSMVVSAERARRTVMSLPAGSALVDIPGVGHHVMLEKPLAVVEILRALLARAESGGP
jgi:pimeloyl-ACP methyl ester carboxylesterase